MVNDLLAQAKSEAQKYLQGISPNDLDRRATETAVANFTEIRNLWYPIRDVVAGKKSKVYSQLTENDEKFYAPLGDRDAIRAWFMKRFFEGHTFFVERTDGTTKKIGTANPVHIH